MKAFRLLVCAAAAGASLAFAPAESVLAASVAPVMAPNGMVVTAQHLATRVGVDVLKDGGNAVDAAVAVGYALAVVYPAAGNLGGGGFMTIQLADGRKTFLDFREKAPLAAKADMYLDKDGNVVKGASTHGHLAVGVPGTVSGLEYAREKYGTMKRTALIAPAIALADRGFALQQGDVDMFHTATKDFEADPASGAIFLNKGKRFEAGDKLVQKDLARTLREISVKGTDGFYKGWVAQAIVASSQAGKGIITQADLDQYKTRELAPVECDYRGYHVVSAPPPSSGGVVICEMLNILSGYPLRELGWGSAQGVHYQIEAMRHAYVDRNSQLGDPDFVKNPIQRLLDPAYAEKIRAAIDPRKAAVSAELKPGVAPHEGSNTTHYSIADKWGNAVSVTYTLNDWFGAKVTAARTGVLLNNEMDDFTSKVGVPNMYGLVQGEANAIAPGKRPLSSMSPTIVTKDGKPVMVVGTPGGSRIITAVLLTMINAIDYDMNVQEAVDAPRFHQQWQPEATNVERHALSPDTRRMLEAMGHRFGKPQEANHLAAIIIGAPSLNGTPVGNNRFYGANDPRRNTGLALGY
ncbi:gamma-glutamyltransferase [Roseateles chitosanitabidus]|uniref:gamma-glutamyltransferase n=1 Tax=Roseateles chitosanitabidus TaxID=65048 RepID=UPI00082A8BEC